MPSPGYCLLRHVRPIDKVLLVIVVDGYGSMECPFEPNDGFVDTAPELDFTEVVLIGKQEGRLSLCCLAPEGGPFHFVARMTEALIAPSFWLVDADVGASHQIETFIDI